VNRISRRRFLKTLGLSGAGVYGLLQWRAHQLAIDQQRVLRSEVLVARGSVRPKNIDSLIDEQTETFFQQRLQKSPVAKADLLEVRRQIREQIKAEHQIVPPGAQRTWNLQLGHVKDSLADRPLQLRSKFNAADQSTSGTFVGLWVIGPPAKGPLSRLEPMSLAPETFHEFDIPANVDENGVLSVTFVNLNNMALLFPLDEGIEVLYHQGGFGLNFIRGLGIIFCWMALLAALAYSYARHHAEDARFAFGTGRRVSASRRQTKPFAAASANSGCRA